MNNTIKGTSCYANAKSGNLVSITGDGGNAWGFYGQSYKKLAPSLKLYEYWRDNPDHLSDMELIEYYVQQYYNHRLINLNVEELFNILRNKFGEEIILLCHELPSESPMMDKKHFCHRRLDVDYFELETGIIIPEIGIDESGIITYYEQPNYKTILKKVMKK